MPKLITISYMHIHWRYIDENTRRSNSYKQYHNKMPQYLFNRPRHIVQHCLEKIDLAKSIPAHHVVNKGQGQFKVHSQTMVNMWYHVSFGGNNEPPLCTCKEWESSHLPCKHMFADFRHNPDWVLRNCLTLPGIRRFFSLDEKIIFPVINIDTAEQPADIEPQDVPSHPNISKKENASIILLQCKPLYKRFTIQLNKITSCLLCPVLACCCVWSLCVLCPPSMAEKNWAITFNSHTLFPVDNI